MHKLRLDAMVRERVPIPLAIDERLGELSVQFVTFDGLSDKKDHIALVFEGCLSDVVPVRLHSECLTGDLFRSMRCDCGFQLDYSIRQFRRTGGCLLYLRQEGRGIGIKAKLDAYALQDQGLDTYEANRALGFPADMRDYASAAQMLRALGYTSVALMTNNPSKKAGLEMHGIEVRQQVPLPTQFTRHNERYLRAKQRSGHHICADATK